MLTKTRGSDSISAELVMTMVLAMFVFENHLFQPSPHPQNPRLTESSALNACYDWLPKGRSINYKNLDYEIETQSHFEVNGSVATTINYKNLDYEIETTLWGDRFEPLPRLDQL